MEINQLRSRLEQERGKYQHFLQELASTQTELTVLDNERLRIEEVQRIIQEVARATQAQLEVQINDVVSMALESIFDEPTEFRLRFIEKRGKTETEIVIMDSSKKPVKPMDNEGGGLANVVAFALRVSLWSITRDSRNTLWLDEPFHFLHSVQSQKRIAELLKTLSEELDLQIIMIVGEGGVIGKADRIFHVVKKKGISEVSTEEVPQ